MKYPFRFYTIVKTPLYVARLGLGTGLRTVERFLTAPSSELLEVPVPGTARKVLVRGQSSDRRCYDQIFVMKEYALAYRGEPRLIVDGGANVGYSTVYFATRFPRAKVVAIEPEPSNAELLRRNVAGLENVEVVEGALWPVDEALAIANPVDDKWSFTVKVASATDPKVAGITIDEILRRTKIDRVGILKLDIEGAEVELFEKCASWIDRVDQIVVELHPKKRPTCRDVFERAVRGKVRARRKRGENEWVALA